MGGYGSTRWGWRSTRATTDEFLALDIRLLARRGYFTAEPGDVVRGTISWTAWARRAGRIGVEYAGATPQRITLQYCVHGPGEQMPDVTESIAVGRTACHFGGRTGVVRLPRVRHATGDASCGRRRVPVPRLPRPRLSLDTREVARRIAHPVGSPKTMPLGA